MLMELVEEMIGRSRCTVGGFEYGYGCLHGQDKLLVDVPMSAVQRMRDCGGMFHHAVFAGWKAPICDVTFHGDEVRIESVRRDAGKGRGVATYDAARLAVADPDFESRLAEALQRCVEDALAALAI